MDYPGRAIKTRENSIQIESLKSCSGCAACANACPKSAISIVPNSEGFLYPKIHSDICIQCGLCDKTCPVLHAKSGDESIQSAEENFTVRASFAVQAIDENIRLKSSSGGIFTCLAEKIIAEGGVIFGAAFDSDLKLSHRSVETSESLEALRGSKYLQSEIGNSYQDVRRFLKEGKKVLFSGTPCQVGGLKAFLKKDFENLFTVDVVCHGVPSPALFEKYVQEHSHGAQGRPVKTAFRRKDDGWKLYSLSFAYANESEYRQTLDKDKYMQLFLKDHGLREGCYQCKFRGDNHVADITLADFWGIGNILPEMDDDKGTSLVIVQTEKGAKFFDSCKDSFLSAPVNMREAVKYNPSYFTCKKRSPLRNKFYEDFENSSIDFLFRRFGKSSLKQRTKRFVKRGVKKAFQTFLGKKGLEQLKKKMRG